jgi:uroporphyrinogen decarboxylase
LSFAEDLFWRSAMAARMTSKERLWAAIRHEEVDKVPCSPRLGQALRILYDDYETDDVTLALKAARPDELDIDPHFNTGTGVPNVVWAADDSTQGLKDIRITLSVKDDGDCELITRAFETPAGQLREVLRKPKPGHPEYGLSPDPARLERLVKGPEDLAAMRYLVPDPADFEVATAYHEMVDRVGDDGLVAACVRSPLDCQAGTVYAMEDLMIDYFTRRDFFDELLGIWFDKMMAETKAVLVRGVKVIFGSWFYTSLSVGWSPAIFREVFLPMLKGHVDLVHSYDAAYDYYDDGKVMGIIDMVKDAGVDVLETLTPPPVGDADLAEIKRRIGDRVCLKGYGDLLYVIKMGTPEDVERMVKDAMAVAAPGGGFILGTSDSIREGTPRENLRTYFEAAREYGRRPRA